MLIEFTVSNFRSILDQQSFSMVAGRGKEFLDSHTFDPRIPGVPRLLRAAMLYGPNASGKTNIIRAMQFVASFVSESAAETKPGEKIPADPHLLDVQAATSPTEFDLFFAVDGVRYQYGFALDQRRIRHEWLYAAPEGRQQCWFERECRSSQETDWYFGPNMRGRKRIIQESTRENALFLSTAAQLNHKQLLPVWNWFNNVFRPLSHPNQLNNVYSTYLCQEASDRRDILEFMRAADLGIDDISVKRSEWGALSFPENMPEEVKDELISSLPEHRLEPKFLHRRTGDSELVPFAFEDESAGTQAVFSLAGPWLDVLANGYVLALDELDSSLHPFLAEKMVNNFFDRQKNVSSAQLIFSAHNPYLLRSEFLRRDQVFFVAKPKSVTRIVPHSDFHPRRDEERMKNYLGGRYGALPKIS